MLNVKLVVVGGDAKPTEVTLRLPAVIGRGRGVHLTVPHKLISRRHCELFERDGRLVVRDLKSLNGTFVDNHRIKADHEMEPNQLLTVGTVTFRAVYDSSSPVVDPSPAHGAINARSAAKIRREASALAPKRPSSPLIKPIRSPAQPELLETVPAKPHGPLADTDSRDALRETDAAPTQRPDAPAAAVELIDAGRAAGMSVVAALADLVPAHKRSDAASADLVVLTGAGPSASPSQLPVVVDDGLKQPNPAGASVLGLVTEEAERQEKVAADESALQSFLRKKHP